MIIKTQNVFQNGRREQARLALSLVDSLGLDGAIFACRANGWDGVLDILIGTSRETHRQMAPALVHHR